MSLECACVHYNNGRCKKFTDDKHTSWCNAEGFCKYIEPSNADRIRDMSDEELAWELMTWRMETEAKHHGVESNYPNTQATILEWLKQPADNLSVRPADDK